MISPPSKPDVKVSFHPAQVGTPNKDKEKSSSFKILEPPPKKK